MAIVVPTKNRPLHMKRQLDWYRSLGLPVHVYIGSSSDSGVERQWLRGVDCGGYGGTNVRITYSHVPQAHEMEAAYSMAVIVKEPFTALCGDDDFFDPAILAQLAKRLDWLPESTAIAGRTILYRLWEDGIYGELEAADEHSSGVFRLYWTPILVEALRQCRGERTPHRREAGLSAVLDAQGSIEMTDVIHLWRQAHPYRLTSDREKDQHPGWRTRLGRRLPGLVRLNQWCHSFDPDRLNLARLRRYPEDWGFDRFERFIRKDGMTAA